MDDYQEDSLRENTVQNSLENSSSLSNPNRIKFRWPCCDNCDRAAINGHLECLKYHHQNGGRWDEWTSQYATRYSGDLDCLKYLHQNGCARPIGEQAEDVPSSPWDEWVFSYAALNGHLEILKYLYQEGCPWEEKTIYGAALNGHFECLKFLHQKGCARPTGEQAEDVPSSPWNNNIPLGAARNGHLECLKYAHQNGCARL